MRTFTDTQGRTWSVAVTVGSAKRAKTLAGEDLLQVLDGGFPEFLQRLADPERLVNLLWALVQPQATAAKVTPDDFAEGLGGDTIDEASRVLVEELIDFFPPQTRPSLRRIAAKADEVRTAYSATIEAKVTQALEGELFASKVQQALGDLSTTVPESSESTQTP